MSTPFASRFDQALTPETLKETYPEYDDQLRHTETLPSEPADHVPAENVLPDSLADGLEFDLYSHQADALTALQDGENVTVATSTSSGKTWIYTLYYALRKQQNPDARALFLYPTKALSADQEQAVNNLLNDVGVDATAETYDGDTNADRKPLIRDQRDIIISNFAGINHYLSGHTKWHDFFENVQLLVIDESHTYTGVHGMHVSWIIRRLRRVLDHYDTDPQMVCSTATIGNPAEHSRALTGDDFTVIDTDGSPRGRRDIAFWVPPIDDTDSPRADTVEDADVPAMRKQAGTESAQVTTHLGLAGVQTLTFVRSRQGTEIAAKQARTAAEDHPTDAYLSTDPYHAGLSKKKRRAVETQLKHRDLDAVFTTNALELGLDIGSVDATVLTGYPGTRQSFWQQIGRAGRGTSDALSVYIPRADAIDQYILDFPDYLLEDDVEDAVVDITNNPVYARHVLCAADELPVTDADVEWFGPRDRLERAVSVWKDAGKMVGGLDRGAQYNGPPRPQQDISMYATTDEQYDVRCTNGDIDMEPIQKERAYRDYHPGALVMYDGDQYEVTDLVEDRHQPYVEVEQVYTNEYTVTSSQKRVHDITEERSIDLGDGYSLHAGMGTVDIHYTDYQRRSIQGNSTAGHPQPIDLPPISLNTQLMWVELPTDFQTHLETNLNPTQYLSVPAEEKSNGVTPSDWTFAGGLHGAEHGMIKMAPLELRLDNSDMGGLSVPLHSETMVPTWFIHDAVEGGVGFAHSIYENFTAVAAKTHARVQHCDCHDEGGCPSCLMSSQCGNQNEPLHKSATTLILSELLDRATE